MSDGSNRINRFDKSIIVWHSRMRFIVDALARLQQEYIRLKQMRDKLLGI